jgi:hypothetical protein
MFTKVPSEIKLLELNPAKAPLGIPIQSIKPKAKVAKIFLVHTKKSLIVFILYQNKKINN